MNIGIDARPLGEYKTGIGYYLDGLLSHILDKDKENNYFLFSDRKINFINNGYKNLYFVEDTDSKVLKKTVWYMIKLPSLLKHYKVNLFWGTQHVLPYRLENIKSILTVHDLVAYEMPETMNNYNRIINKLLIPRSLRLADSIVAVSYSTKDGIYKHFGNKLNMNKINVIYEDGQDIFVDRNDEDNFFSENINIQQGKYILYLGTLEPRKNILVLLKAYNLIKKNSDLKLILCGKLGWKANDIKKELENNISNKDVIYLNYVTDKEKYILMKNCFAFVFPSLYEGFGLPVLEAMKLNSVTVVSDTSSLKELVDEEELKFNCHSYNQLAEKILALYENSDKYESLRDYCIRRGKEFNWDNIADQYLNEFDTLVTKK